MICVYDRKETDFTKNGMAVLDAAKDVCIHREINGDYTIEFSMPPCDKWKHVKPENILKAEGQLFRIKTITGTKVDGAAIYYDSSRKHIQYIGNMIGATPRDIMTTIFANTGLHVMTVSDISALGMEWVTDLTDFFEVSKVTPIGALQTLMEGMQKQGIASELYIDNYNIALVKTIGKDRGIRIDPEINAKSVEMTRDTSKLITRLYPYGKDDLHIDSITPGNRQYIDSPNIDTYGIYEGFSDFDNIDTPEELLKAAQWMFSEDNPERVDVAKLSFTAECADLYHTLEYKGLFQIGLGDLVDVYDRDFDVISKQRVVSIDTYPYEPEKTKITVGTPKETISDLFGGMVEESIKNDIKTNEQGELKTSWLEYMQKNETISINNDLQTQDVALYKTGALWESPDGASAVAIINGRVAISNEKRNGKWYWTTVADGGKMIVNEVWTGVLYTSLITLMGEGAKLEVENNMISFRDDTTLRARWGFDGEQYVFEMYEPDGITKTLYFDEAGEMWVKGSLTSDSSINVKTDVNVGRYLRVGWNGTSFEDGSIQLGSGASVYSSNEGENLELAASTRVNLRAASCTKNNQEIATYQTCRHNHGLYEGANIVYNLELNDDGTVRNYSTMQFHQYNPQP